MLHVWLHVDVCSCEAVEEGVTAVEGRCMHAEEMVSRTCFTARWTERVTEEKRYSISERKTNKIHKQVVRRHVYIDNI